MARLLFIVVEDEILVVVRWEDGISKVWECCQIKLISRLSTFGVTSRMWRRVKKSVLLSLVAAHLGKKTEVMEDVMLMFCRSFWKCLCSCDGVLMEMCVRVSRVVVLERVQIHVRNFVARR